MPFTPSGQETDWAYSITTVPGTHMGQAYKHGKADKSHALSP